MRNVGAIAKEHLILIRTIPSLIVHVPILVRDALFGDPYCCFFIVGCPDTLGETSQTAGVPKRAPAVSVCLSKYKLTCIYYRSTCSLYKLTCIKIVKQDQSPYAEIMFRAGVTQKDIAEALGYSQNAVSAWFTGKVIPRLSLEEWHKIANLCNTTIDKLPLSFSPEPIHRTNESEQPS